MKRINRILEAVNKAINLALDDYEDIEPISSVSPNSDVIDDKHIHQIKERADLDRQLVDLGLPSGTIWSTYNLGVDKTKLRRGGTHWYGDYYMWGERLQKKDQYFARCDRFSRELNLYRFFDSHNQDKVSKYNINDGYKILENNDDIAYIKSHGKLKIPTIRQVSELIKYTTHEWVTKYNGVRGLQGILFKSKINDKEIFFPAGGSDFKYYYKYSGNNYESAHCLFWTSQRDYENHAFAFDAYKENNGNVVVMLISESRHCALNIRPVLNKQTTNQTI